ncbi:hypothetical protein PG987_000618 [Apiospora arundinis]
MPPTAGTRGRKRKRAQDDEDNTAAEIAMEVIRDALDMLRTTLTKLENMIKDASHGPSEALHALQLDAISTHSKIMDLHFEMISAKASDANIEREAHSFQRQAFKLHQSLDKVKQPQVMTPEPSPIKITLKPGTRRQTRNSNGATDTRGEANLATQAEDADKNPADTADVAIQVNEVALMPPKIPVPFDVESKVKRLLDTSSRS